MSYARYLIEQNNGNNELMTLDEFCEYYELNDIKHALQEALDTDELLDEAEGKQLVFKLWDKICDEIDGEEFSHAQQIRNRIKKIDGLLRDIEEEKKKVGKERFAGKLGFHWSFLKRMIIRLGESLAAGAAVGIFSIPFGSVGALGAYSTGLGLDVARFIMNTLDRIKIVWTWANYNSILTHYEKRLRSTRNRLQRQLDDFNKHR